LPELGIKNLDFKKLYNNGNGITKYGCVFNLDRHDQSGSHWVGLFADLKKGEIYFFDSYGIRPDKRIIALMKRMATFCIKELGNKNIKVDYNKIRHQYGNSECGVYSITFVERMVKGESFEKICMEKTPDSQINKHRNEIFRNQNENKN
jgi:hypothetical protein